MARIPVEELDQLKRSVSLKGLFEARGVTLKKAGKDGEWVGLCVFHSETDPSLHVSEDKGVYHCFGCEASGDALTLVQKMEGVSFRKAFEILRAGYPSAAVPSSSRPVKRSTVLKLPALSQVEESDRELMLHVVRFYHENLLHKPAALEYLRRRGIGSEEAIERHCIGFSDRTLGYRLPASNRAAGASLRSRLQGLGVYAESGHERLRGCITVPLFDEQGTVVQLYGRRISDKVPKDKRHLMLPFPRAGVFNREAFAVSAEMILCESIFDALSFFCNGFRNVTACLGAGGLTEEIVGCFARHGTERAFLAFDPDGGGERGSAEAARRLMEAGVECLRVEFPPGLDANEFALQHPPADKSLAQLLSLARRIGGGRQGAAALELAPAESAGKGLELTETEVSDPSGARSANGLQPKRPRRTSSQQQSSQQLRQLGKKCIHPAQSRQRAFLP